MIVLESIIPFTKDLDFKTPVSEITSISLEREFNVSESCIEGNLDVSGEYKSHDVSANVNPFHFKIPFTIEIPNNLKKDSITLEINDFAYEMNEDKGISVHIELLLNSEEIEEEKEEVDLTRLMDETVIDDIEKDKDIPGEEEKSEVEETNKEENEKKEEARDIKSSLEEKIKNNKSEEFVTYHIHVVKDGETIESICSMYQVSEDYIKEYNDLTEFISGSKILLPVSYE